MSSLELTERNNELAMPFETHNQARGLEECKYHPTLEPRIHEFIQRLSQACALS